MLNKLAISLFIALSVTAHVQAQPIPSTSRYGIKTQEYTGLELPDSVLADPGEKGITSPKLPEVGQTVQEVQNALSQSQQEEMRRMWESFDAAVDQNAQLQSQYPTVHGGVPTELQQLVDSAAKLNAETANRIPPRDDLQQPQVLPQDKPFILPFPTGQRGVIQL